MSIIVPMVSLNNNSLVHCALSLVLLILNGWYPFSTTNFQEISVCHQIWLNMTSFIFYVAILQNGIFQSNLICWNKGSNCSYSVIFKNTKTMTTFNFNYLILIIILLNNLLRRLRVIILPYWFWYILLLVLSQKTF